MTTRELLESGGFTKALGGRNFDLIADAYDHATKDQKTGLVFQGDVGTGKTKAMSILFPDNVNVIRLCNPTMLKEIMPQTKIVEDEEISIWDFDDRDYVLDLGNEPIVSNYGVRIEAVSNFIIQFHHSFFTAGKYKGRLLITTNLQDDELLARYGSRIFDRLSEMCCFVKFSGHSNRKNQKVFK